MKLQPQLSAKHVLTQMLHKSLEILQLPQIELAVLILEEVEKNPLLELSSNSRLEPVVTAPLPAPESFHEKLASQLREAFQGHAKIAEALMEGLDEKGFLLTSPSELSEILQLSLQEVETILRVVKTFDPPGIFASTLQEAFLLQLERRGQEKTLAFRIIEEAFEDFLVGRYAAIKKKFHASSHHLQEAIRQISYLKTRPAENGNIEPISLVYPDLRFEQVDGVWSVSLIEDALPKFRVNEEYQYLLSTPEHKQTMRGFLATAKWLVRSMQRRKDLLVSIGKYLARKQGAFFEGGEAPIRLSAKELAREFGVHESTIFRAIANKTIESPQGLVPIRLLVSPPKNGSAKEVLQRLIAHEEPLMPLTDELLAHELEKAGYKVARRTIAKYRKQLKIKTSSARNRLVNRDL
ncbi:MAG TPA: RNA polymerase factor sigma-54 [Chlamydiales bacterium]|jgi:RNA polymerase sigma-54 factor|nr:RNA polymerase factor sigma-54 [Chlamydiales bacterium]